MAGGTLTIKLAKGSAARLKASGFQLYGFRQVISSNKSGVPLVASRLGDAQFVDTISVDPSLRHFSVYISLDRIAVDHAVFAGDQAGIREGELAEVSTTGIEPKSGGTAGAVTVLSMAERAMVCGLSAAAMFPANDGPAVPYSGFDIEVGAQVVIAPTASILLMWATSTYDLSVFMAKSLGRSVLIATDLADDTIGFDIDAGWQWPAGALWAKAIPPNAELKPLLVLEPGHNRPLGF